MVTLSKCILVSTSQSFYQPKHMYELSWFLPSLFPIFGLALEGGESFKLGEVFREFPMYLCGGHIKKIKLLTFLLEKRRRKKLCLFLKSGRDIRDLMPTYRCIPPSHSKSVGPKSGLGWYSQSHGGHVKQASIWIRLGCLHGLHGNKESFLEVRK